MRGSRARLWAFALIMAFAFAVAGRGFAVPAIAADASPELIAAGMSVMPGEMCPSCKGMDNSKAMAASCLDMCSGLVAILPAAESAYEEETSRFVRSSQSEGRGVTVPPALGPPRPLHLA